VILQQPIAREQMTKLLASGATDLLDGFVSNKTRRKFKARLAWDAKDGKVVFAFEPRPERPGAKRAGSGAPTGKPSAAKPPVAAKKGPAGKAVPAALKEAVAKKAAPAKKAKSAKKAGKKAPAAERGTGKES
jgi:DNA topoisomerase-3